MSVGAAKASIKKVQPAYEKLRRRVGPPAGMREFADGLFDLQEYELAAYAYKHLLYSTHDGGINAELTGRFADCLRTVGARGAADYLVVFLAALDAFLKPRTP
jgi:hypothetical protein